MGKVKWSLSLFLAFFLVGILSTAAFASVMYTLQAVQNGNDLEVSFTGKSDDVGKQFDLVVKNGTTTVYTDTGVTIDGTINIGTFKIPLNIIPTGPSGPVYTAEMYSDSNGSITGSPLARLIIDQPNNNKLYHEPSPNLDVVGSGLANANHTGADVKRKNGQNVHGFYQNNTNSCASCHQTHTSDDSSGNLLMKNGVYSTCSACHDGTTGAYNSFLPTNDKTPDSIAGTFDISADAHGSLHQADGSLKISAAPGGSGDLNSKIWNQNFDCASCHAPHGSGSADENNLNLDPLGWGSVPYAAEVGTILDSKGTKSTEDNKNGKLFKIKTIYFENDLTYGIPTVNPNNDAPYILVKRHLSKADVIANFFYNRAIDTSKLSSTDYVDIIQTYRWENTGYVPDYSLWLQEKGYPYKADTTLYNDDWDNLTLNDADHYNDTKKDITRSTDVHVVWRDGFAWGPGVVNVKSAQISLGIDVETTENVKTLYDKDFTGTDSKGNTIKYIPDSGIEMTKYCTACHTDYGTDPATTETGVLTGSHRHTSDLGVSGLSDTLTCVRCHFAHGTTSPIMKDRTDSVATKEDTVSNTNHSSALRRYIDMDSCYTSGCHNETNNTDPMYLEWSY